MVHKKVTIMKIEYLGWVKWAGRMSGICAIGLPRTRLSESQNRHESCYQCQLWMKKSIFGNVVSSILPVLSLDVNSNGSELLGRTHKAASDQLTSQVPGKNHFFCTADLPPVTAPSQATVTTPARVTVGSQGKGLGLVCPRSDQL